MRKAEDSSAHVCGGEQQEVNTKSYIKTIKFNQNRYQKDIVLETWRKNSQVKQLTLSAN